MNQFLRLPFILLALAVGTAFAGAMVAGRGGQAPAYTVAELQAHLARDPRAWLGRTVRVQGIGIGGSVSCQPWQPPESASCRPWQGLIDAAGMPFLPVSVGAADPLLAALRRLPLAGRLLPPAQVLRWGARASYQVQLQVAPAGSCDQPPCYAAVLLNAADGAQ